MSIPTGVFSNHVSADLVVSRSSPPPSSPSPPPEKTLSLNLDGTRDLRLRFCIGSQKPATDSVALAKSSSPISIETERDTEPPETGRLSAVVADSSSKPTRSLWLSRPDSVRALPVSDCLWEATRRPRWAFPTACPCASWSGAVWSGRARQMA